MSHNPPNRPFQLLDFRQAERLGYRKFTLRCRNCGRATTRCLSEVPEVWRYKLMTDYASRSRCTVCGVVDAGIDFDGVRPGDMVYPRGR